jgi:hypothetical protein
MTFSVPLPPPVVDGAVVLLVGAGCGATVGDCRVGVTGSEAMFVVGMAWAVVVAEGGGGLGAGAELGVGATALLPVGPGMAAPMVDTKAARAAAKGPPWGAGNAAGTGGGAVGAGAVDGAALAEGSVWEGPCERLRERRRTTRPNAMRPMTADPTATAHTGTPRLRDCAVMVRCSLR